MLLDSLVGIGYLTKSDNRYDLAEVSREYLVPGSPTYLGGFVRGWRYMRDSFDRLAEVVRTGQPTVTLETQQAAEEFFPNLVRALHITNAGYARHLAEHLTARRPGARVLDVACGSGVWGIHYALVDAEARVTAHDFPGLLQLTREYADAHGVGERFEYLAGDLKAVAFGEQQHDVVILGNICHSEGIEGSRQLLAKSARALRPGGVVAIVEMVPNDDRTGPPFPLFFALNMLLHTREGGTFTLGEYSQWCSEAGLNGVETVDVGSHSPVILAHKP